MFYSFFAADYRLVSAVLWFKYVSYYGGLRLIFERLFAESAASFILVIRSDTSRRPFNSGSFWRGGAGWEDLLFDLDPAGCFLTNWQRLVPDWGSISPVITFLMMIGRFSCYLCGPVLIYLFVLVWDGEFNAKTRYHCSIDHCKGLKKTGL